MKFHKDFGFISAKYESGGRGVEFISNGDDWGDPGGQSYGVHQLSSAYSMGKFLESKWGEPYAKKFNNFKPGTKNFNKIYKQIAKSDPEGFEYAQKVFYATTHYLPVKNHAEKLGFYINDRAIQEALFSISVQHGGANKIVSAAAYSGVPNDIEKQLFNLYNERSCYVKNLRTLSDRIKSNIINKRYKPELEDCIKIIGTDYEEEIQEELEPSEEIDYIPKTRNYHNWMTCLLAVFNFIVCGAKILYKAIYTNTKNRIEENKSVISDEELPDVESDVVRDVPWMHTAKALMGTDEVRGSGNNPKIIKWAKSIGGFVKSYYTKDSIHWCGLFVDYCWSANDIKSEIKNPLGARNWLKAGVPTNPQYGATMVFWRGKKSGWAGHVGFYVSEDDDYYHILGGNQSDTVNVTKISKNRFLGARWPKNHGTLKEQFKGRIKKKFDGRVSTNES